MSFKTSRLFVCSFVITACVVQPEKECPTPPYPCPCPTPYWLLPGNKYDKDDKTDVRPHVKPIPSKEATRYRFGTIV